MNDRCRQLADLLIADTLHELSDTERETLAAHLAECAECRRLHLALQEDDLRLEAFSAHQTGITTSLEGRLMETIRTGEIVIEEEPRQTAVRFFNRPAARWALAAILVLCVLAGWSWLDTGGGGLVWAEVIARVEQADSFICRRIEKRSGEKALEMIEYRSMDYGLRQDIYESGKLQAVQYIVPQEKMLYALIHRDRTYMRQAMTDEQIAELVRNSSAAEMIKSFREYEHRSLGRKRIEGRQAEGIEIVDPAEWRAIFEEGKWRLWVDIETQWPVRLELEGVARDGKVRKTYTLSEFRWNPELSARDFDPDIPDDYRLIADLAKAEATEEKALEALKDYAALVDGRYPSSLNLSTAIAEAEETLDRKHSGYDKSAGRDLESLFLIRNACDFFTELGEEQDPAYYGKAVDPRDFDRVLMSWRLEDGRYRVVFGDLRTTTLDSAALAERK